MGSMARWSGPGPQPVRGAAVSRGRPVDHEIRRSMESRFQHDFSKVRVFADDRVGAAVDTLNARAVTIGSSILFGQGEYAPHTHSGRSLLAHELAHVVQASGPGRTGTGSGEASAEADADRAAENALSGRPARPSVRAPVLPRFKVRQVDKVPDGQYTVDMDELAARPGYRNRSGSSSCRKSPGR